MFDIMNESHCYGQGKLYFNKSLNMNISSGLVIQYIVYTNNITQHKQHNIYKKEKQRRMFLQVLFSKITGKHVVVLAEIFLNLLISFKLLWKLPSCKVFEMEKFRSMSLPKLFII